MCKKIGDCCSDFKFCEAVLQFSSKTGGDSKIENCEFSSKDKATCLQCKSNFFLYNNKCLKECPTYSVVNKQNNICLKKTSCKNNNCVKCSPSGKCEKCLNGLFLHEDKCMTSCPIGYRANRIDFSCRSLKTKEYSFYWIFPSKSGCSGRCGYNDNDIQYDCSCRHSCLRRGNCCDDFESECEKEFYQEGCKLCSYCFQGNCHECKKNSSKSESESKSENNKCECDEGYSYDMEEDICIKERDLGSSVMSPVNKEMVEMKNISQTIDYEEGNEDKKKEDDEEFVKDNQGSIESNKNKKKEDDEEFVKNNQGNIESNIDYSIAYNEKNKKVKKDSEKSIKENTGESSSLHDCEVDRNNIEDTKEINENTTEDDTEQNTNEEEIDKNTTKVKNNSNNEEEIKKVVEVGNKNPGKEITKNDPEEDIKNIQKNQEIKNHIQDDSIDKQEINKTANSDSEEINESNEKNKKIEKNEKESLKDSPKNLTKIKEPLANMTKYKAYSNFTNLINNKNEIQNITVNFQNNHKLDPQKLLNAFIDETTIKNNLTEINREKPCHLIETSDLQNQTSIVENFIKLKSEDFLKKHSSNSKDSNLTQNYEKESINETESYVISEDFLNNESINCKDSIISQNYENESINVTESYLRSEDFLNNQSINKKEFNLTQNYKKESINVNESYLRNNQKNYTSKKFSTYNYKGLNQSLHENNLTHSTNNSKVLNENLLKNSQNLIQLNNKTDVYFTISSNNNSVDNMQAGKAYIDYNSPLSELFKFISSNKSSIFPHGITPNVYIHGDLSINFLIGNKNPKIITTNVLHNNLQSKEIEQRNNSTEENIEKNYSFLDIDHTHYGFMSRNKTEKSEIEIKEKFDNNHDENLKSSLQFGVKNLK